jgi:hypothetical protein
MAGYIKTISEDFEKEKRQNALSIATKLQAVLELSGSERNSSHAS